MGSVPMHAHARGHMLQQQQQQQQQRMAQQQFGGMYNVGAPNLMMNQQPLPSTGMRRSASQMANGASHPEEPSGKRYRNVLTGVSPSHSMHLPLTLSECSRSECLGIASCVPCPLPSSWFKSLQTK